MEEIARTVRYLARVVPGHLHFENDSDFLVWVVSGNGEQRSYTFAVFPGRKAKDLAVWMKQRPLRGER